jgi:hypothetical protein
MVVKKNYDRLDFRETYKTGVLDVAQVFKEAEATQSEIKRQPRCKW